MAKCTPSEELLFELWEYHSFETLEITKCNTYFLLVFSSWGQLLVTCHHFRLNPSRKPFSWRRKIANVNSLVKGELCCRANAIPFAVLKPATVSQKYLRVWNCSKFWFKLKYPVSLYAVSFSPNLIKKKHWRSTVTQYRRTEYKGAHMVSETYYTVWGSH